MKLNLLNILSLNESEVMSEFDRQEEQAFIDYLSEVSANQSYCLRTDQSKTVVVKASYENKVVYEQSTNLGVAIVDTLEIFRSKYEKLN